MISQHILGADKRGVGTGRVCFLVTSTLLLQSMKTKKKPGTSPALWNRKKAPISGTHLLQAFLNNVQALFQHLIFDGDWHQEPQSVAVHTAAEQYQALLLGFLGY